MKMLVTGGAGFIGSNLVDRLVERGDDVLVVDDLSTGKREQVNPRAELLAIDINDPALERHALRFRADAVAHLAAQASVVVSMSKPVLDAMTNIVGGLRVMTAALASGCSQFVYITTGGALYGAPEYLPCDESHPISPTSGYGLSKWTLERYLAMLLPPSVPLKTLRLANIYGPRQDPYGEGGVVAIFAARMARGEPCYVFGDGEQTRDFVYVGDVVRAIEHALARPSPVTVNIATARGTSVNQLFTMMASEMGYSLAAVHQAERPGEIRHSTLDARRAKELIDWTPETSLEDGLARTLAWSRAQESKRS